MKHRHWGHFLSLRVYLAVVFCIIASMLTPAQSVSAQPSMGSGVEIVFGLNESSEYDYAILEVRVVNGATKNWYWKCQTIDLSCRTPDNLSPLALRTTGYRWAGQTTVYFTLTNNKVGNDRHDPVGSCTFNAPSWWRWSNVTVYLDKENKDKTCNWK